MRRVFDDQSFSYECLIVYGSHCIFAFGDEFHRHLRAYIGQVGRQMMRYQSQCQCHPLRKCGVASNCGDFLEQRHTRTLSGRKFVQRVTTATFCADLSV